MRKITQDAVNAFENNINYKSGNTQIVGGQYFLHGNKIAEYSSLFNDGNRDIDITLAGYNTDTTRERLNGLQGVDIKVNKGVIYLNGVQWDGEWVTIKR